MFDEGPDVFPRDIGDGLEEAVRGHQHLTPHVTLVLLRRGRAGEAEKLVEHLPRETDVKDVKLGPWSSCQQHCSQLCLQFTLVFVITSNATNIHIITKF